MKRIIKFVVTFGLILSCFLLSSCFEIEQSISMKDGKYYISYKIELSDDFDSLATLASAMGEESDFDTNEFLYEMKEEFDKDLPNSTWKTTVNRKKKYVEMSGFIDPKNATDKEKKIMPQKISKGYKIPLQYLVEDYSSTAKDKGAKSDEEDDDYAELISSMIECEIKLDSTFIQNINSAWIETTSNNYKQKLKFEKEKGGYEVKLPFASLLANKDEELFLTVYEK